jgi:hypothetical protein
MALTQEPPALIGFFTTETQRKHRGAQRISLCNAVPPLWLCGEKALFYWLLLQVKRPSHFCPA